jgi:3-oxoadipate enol-lactonase
MRIVWVHGSGYTGGSFKAQIRAFPDSEALLLPGHPDGEKLTLVEELASWLGRRVADGGGGPAIVAGNSLGGAIALRFALDFPEQAAGLILIGTGARLRVSDALFSLIDDGWPGSIETLVDNALSPNASMELRRDAEAWHRSVGRDATRRDYAACNTFDVRDRLAEIKIPALILVGELDEMTPPKYSQYLAEHLPDSKLVIVPGAGHIVQAEKPAEVNAAIEEFLRRF